MKEIRISKILFQNIINIKIIRYLALFFTYKIFKIQHVYYTMAHLHLDWSYFKCSVGTGVAGGYCTAWHRLRGISFQV